ncbi:uncharacterized protein LOC129695730 [Leucoraja erinacea]|uniref:uncharacterized protein LOC129695730 n=1 Tax=Leucoraja erinaceus TaxID=7782 RepID=UPI002455225E|nr:uncharacterized protein LOC129695730 [Leucoraja erinacea]XP_055488920.1 uncharacterized protein LOC129695730 [Leucoraja erinacea]
MKGNEEEKCNKENTETEYSSFRVSELLLAIERLTTGQSKPGSEQKHVGRVAKAEKTLLLNSEKQTTNQSQLVKDERSLGNTTIRSGSSKRTTFIKCPQRSTFECNMNAHKMYTNPQATRRSKLICNWIAKPNMVQRADKMTKPLKKMPLMNPLDEHLPQSLIAPTQKKKKKSLTLDKIQPVQSPFLSIKLAPFRLHIQRSTLAGALRHEPFIDLKDLQLKMYKRSTSKRVPKVVTEMQKCVAQPIPIGSQDKGELPIPLICKDVDSGSRILVDKTPNYGVLGKELPSLF